MLELAAPEAMRLLVVESELPTRDLLSRGLRDHGFSVTACADRAQAAKLLQVERFDLILLESRAQWDGPATEGDATPFIVLNSNDSLDSRLHALRSGADDCIVKPFNFEELLARVKMVLRRTTRRSNPTFRCADLTLDPVRRSVQRNGVEIHLTTREFALLQALLENRGEAVSRSRIIEHVWEHSLDVISNVVEVHIRHLRAKVDKPFGKPLIHTVRGVGYLLALRE